MSAAVERLRRLAMFFRVIRKIIQRHFKYHLLIPLIVGLLVEYGSEFLEKRYHGIFSSVLPFAPILGVVGAYLAVTYIAFVHDTRIGIERITSLKLERALVEATGFFGLGAIGLREWFEPSPQVYLGTILNRKIKNPAFIYNRVLIFSGSAYKDLNSQYLDGYYAKSLIEIHKAHEIGLGYLKPGEIDKIMANNFDLAEGKAIGYYPHWLPEWLRKATPGSWRRIGNRKLALAVVEYGDKNRFMPFSKHGVVVDVGDTPDSITDEARKNAYEKLIKKIKDKVFDGAKIEAEHDFKEFY
jgi:hypothetical protein